MGNAEDKVRLKVLSSLGIRDCLNAEEAFNTVIRALAAASKALDCNDLDNIVNKMDFAPVKFPDNLASSETGILGELIEEAKNSLSTDSILNNQIGVQRLIDPEARKRLAAYYTKAEGLELMAQATAEYTKINSYPIVLADPFLGSGLTITEVLKRLDSSKVRKVWGIEPHPLAALVACCSILYFLKGDGSKLKVSLGDAFHKVNKNPSGLSSGSVSHKDSEKGEADVILTNPPFTRWELLGVSQRSFLKELVWGLGYSRYLRRKQLNLQLVSLFIIDLFLRNKGLLVSVLPASTFYTIYGIAAKTLLGEKYQIQAFIESNNDSSFSIDSGLKEVILIATKRKMDINKETAFITSESGGARNHQIEAALGGTRLDDQNINWVDLNQGSILTQTNWSIFFGKSKLRETLTKLVLEASKRGTIGSWNELYGRNSIMRGVEMYGPDFFFVPNRHWSIIEERSKSITIENNHNQINLEIPRDYLMRALRKPAAHIDKIRPSLTHYLLVLPPEPTNRLSRDIATYIHWSKLNQTARPAIEAFGKAWYSNVHKQIKVKKPFGRVFLPDKVDPTFRNRGFFASYSQTPLIASKNFHIAAIGDEFKDRILAAWLNSSIFIAYFVVASRKITRTWSRLLEDDYLRTPTINVDTLDKHAASELSRAFERITEMELPPLKLQLSSVYRHEVDEKLLEAMGISKAEGALGELYSALEQNLS
jgi:hypothetical protein